ncbi:SDR family oxidoreductase [Bacillus altitudinis]|uniref:SDR family oxidoreductase n=1 Tax=Bacillus altitudinis TaxID=293387 RepID=UPI002E1E4F54|nr:SDR family oxidoreductase [Bacillus altitudinis]
MNFSLEGRNIVVMGVANKRSIAWGIARSLHEAGARLIFTYVGDRLAESVKELASTLERDDSIILPCDVTSDEEIEKCFATIKEKVQVIHGVAHAIAFANKEELVGEYLNTNREGFLLAHNISAYSLTAVAKAALEASVKYLAADLGAEGIRVNSISAGPIRTLSAKGISGFNTILKDIEERAPLRRTTTPEEVGDTALFLFSDLSRGMTGENLHVDSGFHIIAR